MRSRQRDMASQVFPRVHLLLADFHHSVSQFSTIMYSRLNVCYGKDWVGLTRTDVTFLFALHFTICRASCT